MYNLPRSVVKSTAKIFKDQLSTFGVCRTYRTRSKPMKSSTSRGMATKCTVSTDPIEKQSGLMPAVLTTLNDDQSVNLDVIPEYVKYLHSNKTTCILLGGSSGEHMNLSVADRKKLITSWQNACAQYGIHVQVQVGGAPFADVIDLTKFCESVGVGSVVTLPDPYEKPVTANDLANYVALVAAAAPSLPVFYYHNPVKTFVTVNMAKFVKAAEHIKNFGGVKFTSTNLAEALDVLRVIRSNHKFIIGGEQILAPAALIGIDSCMSPMINLFPGLMQRILDAVQNNRLDEARQLQAIMSAFVSDISAQGGRIPAMKVAMELLSGIKMGPPALPMKPVTAENRLIIEQKIKELRKLIQEKGS